METNDLFIHPVLEIYQSAQAVEPRIDKETTQNQEAGGRPLGFKNWLAGRAAR